MSGEFPIGSAVTQDWPIEEAHTVRAHGLLDLPMLATPHLIFMLEDTCVLVAAPFLADGEVTVGTSVHIDHVAGAEVGQSLTVLAELVAVRRRRLVFRVEGRVGRTVIGRGLHERAIVNRAAFTAAS